MILIDLNMCINILLILFYKSEILITILFSTNNKYFLKILR